MHFLRMMMSYGLQNLFLYNSRNYVIPFIRQQVFPLQREVEGSAVSENSEQSFKGMWMIFWHGGYEGGGADCTHHSTMSPPRIPALVAGLLVTHEPP